MKWGYAGTPNGGAKLSVSSDMAIKSAKLWMTTATTQDFRDSKWTSTPLTPTEKSVTAELVVPKSGFSATYAEITFTVGGRTFVQCTQIKILGK